MYPIIIATGGGGAPSHGPYEAGPAGAAGIVTTGSGESLADKIVHNLFLLL